MSNWKSCGNCAEEESFCAKNPFFVMECVEYGRDSWIPIDCPLCGGALSEIREHRMKVGNEEVIRHYRHCFSCHMEFYEDKSPED